MIINTILIFIVFTIFGNQRGVQCLELKEYLSTAYEAVDVFNNDCLHIFLHNFKKNLDNNEDDVRGKTKELLTYYLKSLRLLFPSINDNWKYEFYPLFYEWIVEKKSQVRNNQIFSYITDAIKIRKISIGILNDKHVLDVCKQTLDSLCKPTRNLDEEIHSILVEKNHKNHKYLMKYSRILLLLNENESQTFNTLTDPEKKRTIITIFNDSLINIFYIINYILKSLNVSGKQWDSLNPYEQDRMSIFKNIHSDVINAVQYVFKLQVWDVFTSNGRTDISPKSIQTILQHYNYFIHNQKINWYCVPRYSTYKNSKKNDLRKPKVGVPNRITLEDDTIINLSMVGYYQITGEDEPPVIREDNIKILLDIKLWIMTIKKCSRDLIDTLEVDELQYRQIFSNNNYNKYSIIIDTFYKDIDYIDKPIRDKKCICL